MGNSSDVIAAADWILQNKDTYNIRVANFSLHGSQNSTFRFDPLDKAVERLWFSGVVVVAAAGNYGATQSGVLYAPGNDPFVITVGATGVGEVSADKAVEVNDPPNPNLALDQFIGPDPNGGALPVFDQATWTTAAQNNPSWDAATWTTATWTTATWTTATWTTASW